MVQPDVSLSGTRVCPPVLQINTTKTWMKGSEYRIYLEILKWHRVYVRVRVRCKCNCTLSGYPLSTVRSNFRVLLVVRTFFRPFVLSLACTYVWLFPWTANGPILPAAATDNGFPREFRLRRRSSQQPADVLNRRRPFVVE